MWGFCAAWSQIASLEPCHRERVLFFSGADRLFAKGPTMKIKAPTVPEIRAIILDETADVRLRQVAYAALMCDDEIKSQAERIKKLEEQLRRLSRGK